MVVPHGYKDAQIRTLYHSKLDWIKKKRAQLCRSAEDVLQIQEGQLLLLGSGYRVIYAPQQTEEIDHCERLITTSVNLQDSDQQGYWYRDYARLYLSERLHKLAGEAGYQFNRLYIRAQKTRWGSCSALGNISLNWKLVKAPVFVSDYVIYHELVHTRFMNHGADFWLAVEQLVPDLHDAKDWLRYNGPYL